MKTNKVTKTQMAFYSLISSGIISIGFGEIVSEFIARLLLTTTVSIAILTVYDKVRDVKTNK